MGWVVTDRVADTSTSTTSPFTVSGTAPTGYRTFSAVCSVGDQVPYVIAHQSATEWETGIATYSSSNTLTRDYVFQSSNSNNPVTFSAGNKDVILDVSSFFYNLPKASHDSGILGWAFAGGF
jgi:hypothetical protein